MACLPARCSIDGFSTSGPDVCPQQPQAVGIGQDGAAVERIDDERLRVALQSGSGRQRMRKWPGKFTPSIVEAGSAAISMKTMASVIGMPVRARSRR